MPTAQDWCELYQLNDKDTGKTLDELRERWNGMAPRYANKHKRSSYLAQLTEMLELEPGEGLLDMGCGPGVLSVPIAKEGHDIIAVDFSDTMLEKLRENIAAAGVEERFDIYRRAWQEDWEGISQADTVVSSRSFTTHDVADAIAKLESKAKKRVVITTACGEVPWADARVERALGRDATPMVLAKGLMVLLNYLLLTGRTPELRYIKVPRVPQSNDREELKAFLAKAAQVTPEEQAAFDRFFDKHVQMREDGGAIMDYVQETCWAYLSWEPLVK